MRRLIKKLIAALVFIAIVSMILIYSGSENKYKLGNTVQAKELVEKRDMYTKYYQNADGTITAKIGLMPVHYQNENGDYEDIDLKILEEQNGKFEYSAKKNTFRSYFNDADSIEDSTMAGFEIVNSEGKVRSIRYRLFGALPDSVSFKDNEFKYENVFDGIDLEYILSSERLKENVIVKKPVDEYKFSFALQLDKNVELEKCYGTIRFIDIETNEVLWKIDRPYAVDSKGTVTREVSYELSNDKGYDLISVVLNDEEFIKHAKYPIKIDPTTDIISIAACKSWGTEDNDDSVNSFVVEDDENGTDTGEYHAGIKFNVNIPDDWEINWSKLWFFCKNVYYDEVDDAKIKFYIINEDWNNSSPEPALGKQFLSAAYTSFEDKWVNFDIMPAIEYWRDGNLNYGLMAENNEVSTGDEASCSFSGIGSNEYQPYIEINYNCQEYSSVKLENITACKKWGDGYYYNQAGIFEVRDDESGTDTGETWSGIKFDINIPQETTIKSAKLWMFCENASNGINEDYSRMNLYLAGNDWNNSSDYPGEGQLIMSKSYAGRDNSWMSFDISQQVQNWKDGILPNYGIIATNAEVTDKHYSCIFSGSNAATNKPYIEIVYSKPLCEVISPYSSQIFANGDGNFYPQITVSHSDNNDLTCKYYVNSESTLRGTEIVTGTSTSKTITFSTGIDVSSLNGGLHSLKFEVDNGVNNPIVKIVNIEKIECLFNSSTSNIRIYTNIGLENLYNYRYTIDSNSSSWVLQRSFVKNGYLPDTLHNVNFEVRDEKGSVKQIYDNIYTKSQVPRITLSNITTSTIEMASSDENPATTQYQIMVNNKYLTSVGTLTTTPTWITLTNKMKTITSLSPNTIYTLKAKTKNTEGIETVWSNRVSGKTKK